MYYVNYEKYGFYIHSYNTKKIPNTKYKKIKSIIENMENKFKKKIILDISNHFLELQKIQILSKYCCK